MLQERIEELGSGILKYKEGKVYLTGFMSSKCLDYYYNKKIDCRFSNGIYDKRELNWGKIRDGALFILLNYEDEVICKYQFEVLDKNTIKYKDSKNNNKHKTYSIRKCKYTGIYNFISRETVVVDEKNTRADENRLFNTIGELKVFFYELFGVELKY